jgi:hypothetical protein
LDFSSFEEKKTFFGRGQENDKKMNKINTKGLIGTIKKKNNNWK